MLGSVTHRPDNLSSLLLPPPPLPSYLGCHEDARNGLKMSLRRGAEGHGKGVRERSIGLKRPAPAPGSQARTIDMPGTTKRRHRAASCADPSRLLWRGRTLKVGPWAAPIRRERLGCVFKVKMISEEAGPAEEAGRGSVN